MSMQTLTRDVDDRRRRRNTSDAYSLASATQERQKWLGLHTKSFERSRLMESSVHSFMVEVY